MFESPVDGSAAMPAKPAGYDFQPFINSVVKSRAETTPSAPNQLTWIELFPKGAPISDVPQPTPVPPKAADNPAPVLQKAPSDRPVNNTDESKAIKIAREGLVLGGGLSRSMLYGLANLPQKLPEIGTSMAIGAALNVLSKSGTMGAAATLVVGGYFTSRYILNAINDTERWNRFGAAVTDTWHSSQNMGKNIRDVSETGGNFAFDTGVSMASGYVGYKNKALGELILSVIKLPVPVPAVVLPPALSTATMYMAVFPAPFLYKHSENFDYNPKHSPVF